MVIWGLGLPFNNAVVRGGGGKRVLGVGVVWAFGIGIEV